MTDTLIDTPLYVPAPAVTMEHISLSGPRLDDGSGGFGPPRSRDKDYGDGDGDDDEDWVLGPLPRWMQGSLWFAVLLAAGLWGYAYIGAFQTGMLRWPTPLEAMLLIGSLAGILFGYIKLGVHPHVVEAGLTTPPWRKS